MATISAGTMHKISAPAAKKGLQDNNDLFEGTTTRAKKMRLENHANESEVCETEDFQKSTEKKNKEEKEYGWTRGSETGSKQNRRNFHEGRTKMTCYKEISDVALPAREEYPLLAMGKTWTGKQWRKWKVLSNIVLRIGNGIQRSSTRLSLQKWKDFVTRQLRLPPGTTTTISSRNLLKSVVMPGGCLKMNSSSPVWPA